jgi:hypothetical protein
MGTWANAKRSEINKTFEAASGDMRGDVEPVFISRRADGQDVITGEKTMDGAVMTVAYQIVDGTLDDDDVAHIFAIAYLEVLTDGYYDEKVTTIAMRNSATEATRTFANDG